MGQRAWCTQKRTAGDLVSNKVNGDVGTMTYVHPYSWRGGMEEEGERRNKRRRRRRKEKKSKS